MRTNLNDNICQSAAETEWTVKAVEDQFKEALSTLKKLPPAIKKGYFNSWPDIVYTPNELMFQEKRPMRILPTPGAISRLDQTFEWMRWITIEERKLIWKRAAKMRWKTICWELGCNRATAWRRWNIACVKIVASLNTRKTIAKRILHNK
jgi:hypothetical protein